MEHTQHTAGAYRVADILLGDQDRLKTQYGIKTREGLADLVDLETAAPALLAACEAVTALRPKSIMEDFAYQGPPSRRWLNGPGKLLAERYGGYNDALHFIQKIIRAAIAAAKPA